MLICVACGNVYDGGMLVLKGGDAMLSKNIRILRKQKGMSQEIMAQQLNVVRQTVSKWEKGLSVPDAEMLIQVAELFEVSVNELLGTNIESEKKENEIVNQLTLLNEQLANKSRRNHNLLKGIMIGLCTFLVIVIVINVAHSLTFKFTRSSEVATTTKMTCTLDGKEYIYNVIYNEQYQIIGAGGDAWIANHVQTEQYSDANILMAQIQDYFIDRGGSVKMFTESD